MQSNQLILILSKYSHYWQGSLQNIVFATSHHMLSQYRRHTSEVSASSAQTEILINRDSFCVPSI